MASSIRYLLPIPSSSHSDDDDGDASDDDGDNREDKESVIELYQQARPLVHPHSNAAIKTLGKMLDDPELMRRMLQRNQKLTGTLGIGGQRAFCSSSSSDAGAAGASSHHQVSERLEFMAVCEEMILRFDPQARQSREIRLAAMKQLLLFYKLHVDDVAYRRWEQRLPEDTERVSVSMLTQAFLLWFNETHLIEHFKSFKHAQQLQQQQQQHTHESDDKSLQQRANKSLEKAQSTPHLHPFELLRQQNDATLSFDYEKCARSPAMSSKTLGETNSLKSKLIIHATQELRRKTKILSRLDTPLATPEPQSQLAVAQTLAHTSSSPSLNIVKATTDTTTTRPNQLHERLHQEKLARDVLRRCSTHSLAPSNRARASKLPPQLRQQKAQQALAKQTRLQNVETAKAFSASVAMISRHIQNEELRDLRELHREQQAQIVDDRKHWGRVHRAHCRTLAEDKKSQHLREVHAMKTIAREELELVRSYLGLRQGMLKCNKQPFALSESTSTLFQQPPEILAAKATAKTTKQKKKLLATEKEHLDHVRSLQLLDYVYDKRRAVMEALKPKAEAALVEVELETADAVNQHDLQLTVEDLWEQLRARGVDMSSLLPPPNSPPAALKYFGTSRPVQLPPFASSAERTLS